MYPKNSATPPILAVGSIYLIADGTIQTSGASVRVKTGAGAWGAGGGTLAYDTTGGAITYTPTQAETNDEEFLVTVYKASCTSASITVITTAGSTAGKVHLGTGEATAIVDEWKSQSQSDPTGFHVNVMEVDSQTVSASSSMTFGAYVGGAEAHDYANSGDAYAYLDTNLGANGANATEAGGTGDHLTAVALADATSDAVIAGAVWDALTASYGVADSYGAHVESLSAGGDATEAKQDTIIAATTAAAMATSVWNAATVTYGTAGSYGEHVESLAVADMLEGFFQIALRSDSAIATDRAAILALLNADEGSGAGNYTVLDSQEALDSDLSAILLVLGNPSADLAGDLAAVAMDVTNILTDTGTTIPALIATAQADLDTITGSDGVTLATTQGNYAPNKVVPDAAGTAATEAEVISAVSGLSTLTEAQVNAQCDAAIETYHLDHLFASNYDPASKPGVSTALLNELIEDDGGVSRYTANALEQASGTGATAEDVWTYATRVLTAGTNLNDLSTADVNAQVDAAIETYHLDHLLATAYDPASKPGAATALFNELIVSDAGVSQFSTNALENAPSGSTAVTITPIASTVDSGEVVAQHLTIYYGEEKTPTITVIDSDGDAIDCSAKTLTFICMGSDRDTKEFEVEDANIAVAGAGNNQCTVTIPETATLLEGDYTYALRAASTDTPAYQMLARGQMTFVQDMLPDES